VLNPERSSAYHPLFQVLFSLNDGSYTSRLRLGDVSTRMIPGPAQTAQFDLLVDFEEYRDENDGPAGLGMIWEYATDLFDEDTVTVMAERLLRLLELVTRDLDVRISQLSLLSPAERDRQLVQWNGPPRDEEPLGGRADEQDRDAPLTVREQMLCDLFTEILDVPDIAVNDNFFALGGYSLLAIRLISRIRTVLNVRASVRDIFGAPTVGKLAKRLDELQNSSQPKLR
jgi:non-ribosomal peptide synthetase component F